MFETPDPRNVDLSYSYRQSIIEETARLREEATTGIDGVMSVALHPFRAVRAAIGYMRAPEEAKNIVGERVDRNMGAAMASFFSPENTDGGAY